jgi:hypothetical protein
VVNVFAREITDDLAGLVKKIDEVVGKNQDKRMAGFVVLLTDDPDQAEKDLVSLAERHGIKNVPLTVFDGSAGPPNYKIAKDADVTVMMWVNQTVKVNHAFAKGELNSESIDKILADSAKILN